jgi:hypothetical protein
MVPGPRPESGYHAWKRFVMLGWPQPVLETLGVVPAREAFEDEDEDECENEDDWPSGLLTTLPFDPALLARSQGKGLSIFGE